MASVASLVRSVPSDILRTFIQWNELPVGLTFDWSAKTPDLVKSLMTIVRGAEEPTQSRVVSNADRVAAMSDEAGQAALFAVAPDREVLESLPNGRSRACWLLVNETVWFRHAEETRYTDERRRGRMWDGFVGAKNLAVSTEPDALDRFKAAVSARYSSPNVHVDIFERQRVGFGGETFQLIQATIYLEGRPDDDWAFVDGELARRSRRPVLEAAVTYEPGSGVIEVVAKDRKSRGDLAGVFAKELLGADCGTEKLPLRQFDLDALLQVHPFPTDPEDGIESVRVTELRLMPLDATGERVTLECSRESPNTIWTMAAEHFGDNNPLEQDWIVTRAKLVIQFQPSEGSHRRKTLPLTITMPQGCDLKDRTERERVVGEKYLGRWHLVKDV
jgi:hypothetical protein